MLMLDPYMLYITFQEFHTMKLQSIVKNERPVIFHLLQNNLIFEFLKGG